MNSKQINAGNRIAAMFLDHLVMTFIIMFLAMPVIFIGFDSSLENDTMALSSKFDWKFILMILAVSLYFNKDIIQGKSIAKRALNQEVVNINNNKVASPIKCLIRNLFIVIWPIEVIVVLANPTRRIGDFVAGTKIDFVSSERDSKPKIDFKQVAVSIIIGFLMLFGASFLVKEKVSEGAFVSPDYIESSFNKELSLNFEEKLNELQSNYLLNTNVNVYDSIKSDSLKFVSATFYLTQNFIENETQLEEIKNEIFNTMFGIVPKGGFILFGKFVYNGRSTKSSTERYYDWRNLK